MTNLDIIAELYRAFREKDYAAFLAICHPDLEWQQNLGFPGGGHHHGPQAVVDRVFRAFDGQWSDFSFKTERMFDAGEAVWVVGAYTGRHRGTGRTFTAAAAHLYELDAGKLRRYRQFTDTKTIWDAIA